jgi:hypothetical protein
MTKQKSDAERAPKRSSRHEALAVFLGDWKAEGTSFGGDDQSPSNPRAGATPWSSIHTARWHSGEFFIVQDERANGPFDTLAVIGVDAASGRYFATTFENHGFHRRYEVAVDGDTWTFTGEHERARYVFSEDGKRQTIRWEWKPADDWLPLCDRVAVKVA